MLPTAGKISEKSFKIKERQPGKTYRLDIEKERIYGYADGREAVEQAIYLILNTERYDYVIYSWNYGVELEDLCGKSTLYAISEIERRIREALTQDDRVIGVDAFSFITNKNKIHVKFTVHTIYGDIETGKEVEL